MHGGGSPMHFAALRGDVGMLKELPLHAHPNPNANPSPNPNPSPRPNPNPNSSPNQELARHGVPVNVRHQTTGKLPSQIFAATHHGPHALEALEGLLFAPEHVAKGASREKGNANKASISAPQVAPYTSKQVKT